MFKFLKLKKNDVIFTLSKKKGKNDVVHVIGEKKEKRDADFATKETVST